MTSSSFFDELMKCAADEKKSPAWDIAKIIGGGALGLGLGTAGGLVAGHLADRLSEGVAGSKIPKALLYAAGPLLGTAGGIAYSIHKAKEQEAIQRALKDSAGAGTG